ncbi:MAG: hypothetical protein Q9162_005529 [Coniocarpon cinnabarinum]
MAHADGVNGDIIPAHLDFLAIFNPALVKNEDFEKDQILFYWSRPKGTRKDKRIQNSELLARQQEQNENERMRQIGLARGMSICLTQIPANLRSNQVGQDAQDAPLYEYSSREVSPPNLLREQLLRANRIFLLHHGYSLGEIYRRLPRAKFCGLLDIYWSQFAKTWDVLLHGNPLCDAFTSSRLAAAGELGVGVGEEEWGSAERGFLEGVIEGTEGLVDLLVLRSDSREQKEHNEKDSPSNGRRRHAKNLARGIVFLGSGALTPMSVVTLSEWMQHAADFPSTAYGVQESPSSTRAKSQRKNTAKSQNLRRISHDQRSHSFSRRSSHTVDQQPSEQTRPAIPPSVVSVIEESLDKATADAEAAPPSAARASLEKTATAPSNRKSSYGDWGKILKLGYGSSWGLLGTQNPVPGSENASTRTDGAGDALTKKAVKNRGEFLIGLTGVLDEPSNAASETTDEHLDGNRVSVRTIYTETYSPPDNAAEHSHPTNGDESKTRQPASEQRSKQKNRLRVLLYKDEPFLYALLFDTTTPSLAMTSFYHTLHRQFRALYKAMEATTSPQRVAERLVSTNPERNFDSPVYDLVFDTSNSSLRSSIPDIPGTIDHLTGARDDSGPWTRLEALNVHTQALALLSEAHAHRGVHESSVRTQRDWWILWLQQRVSSDDIQSQEPMSINDESSNDSFPRREAILIRKYTKQAITQSQHHAEVTSRQTSVGSAPQAFGLSRFIGRNSSSGDSAPKDAPDSASSSQTGTMKDRVSVDPRRYVESLFNLNR